MSNGENFDVREHEEWATACVPLVVHVPEDDWATGLEKTIGLVRHMMSIQGPISPLMRDVAVATTGRILAVIQCSLDGPVVTRLDLQVQY
jgi:hypothetical protein